MAATIQIQGAVPFAGNYQSFNVPLLKEPPEGPLTVPVSVSWVNDTTSPNFSMEFQLQGQRNLQITQICALYVDNLSNDADVVFYFPDTQFRLDVPAYTVGVFPVVTNGLQFTAQCSGAAGADMTFVQILNFSPPPVAVEKSVFQTVDAAGSIAMTTGTVHTNVVTGGGTLRGLDVSFAGVSASAVDTVTFSVTDDTGGGGGALLFSGEFGIGATVQNFNFNPSGLAVQFVKGLTLTVTDNAGHLTAGTANINVFTSP